MTTYYAMLATAGDPSTKTSAVLRFVEDEVSFQRWDGDGWVEDQTLADYIIGDSRRDVWPVTEAEAMALVAADV